MLKVKYYELNSVENNQLLYAIIITRYKDKWIFVRHKERVTWEIPAGHREEDEDIISTASRELIEETGAINFNIVPVCIYSVESGGTENYGQLFYAEVKELGKLPDFEIGEIEFFQDIPENLTYPEIQRILFRKVQDASDAANN